MDLRGKKLLLLGGAAQHCKVVEAAHMLGVEVYVTDYLPVDRAPAKQIADKYFMINVTEIDQLIQLCKNEKIDGVLSVSLDFCMHPYQKLCEAMNFPCFGTQRQFEILSNKKIFKKVCSDYNVDVIPEYTEENLIENICVTYPIIIKPAQGSGSKNQKVCFNSEDALKALMDGKKLSEEENVIIEQYMEDKPDFTISYLVVDGEVYPVRIADRYIGSLDDQMEKVCIAAVSPSKYTEHYFKTAHNSIVKMLKGIGLKNAPVFFQGFIDGDTVRLYDPGLRFAGGEYERFYKKAYGLDLISFLVEFALTGCMKSFNEYVIDPYVSMNGNYAVNLQTAVRPGKISKIFGLEAICKDEDTIVVFQRYYEGDEVKETYNVNQRFAEIDVMSSSIGRLKDKIKLVQERLRVVNEAGENMVFAEFDAELLDEYNALSDVSSSYNRGIFTEKLSHFAAELEFDDLPSDVVELTKMFIFDYYSAVFAGYRVNKTFNKAVMCMIDDIGGDGQASVYFREKKYPVMNAAFMNAVLAHGADMDDGNKVSAGHIGTHVISSVFAMAEYLPETTWEKVVVAINVGYEMFNRIAGSAQPSLYRKGFHSTGVAGGIACAAACAKLLGLGYEGIYNSVSLAAIQASGLIIIDESGQNCKPINPGNAARIGVESAILVKHGVQSSMRPLESGKGWFHAFADSVNEETILDGLGCKFTISDSYIKLYPTCRHTHSCIDAGIELGKEIFCYDNNKYIDIVHIKVFIYSNAIKSAGHIVVPKTIDEAKFSIAYALAVALYKQEYSLDDLSSAVSVPVRYLAERVELISSEEMEDREQGIRGSKVLVILADGREFEKTVLSPKGEKISTEAWNDLASKMLECSKGIIDYQKVCDLIDFCRNIDMKQRYRPLIILEERENRMK